VIAQKVELLVPEDEILAREISLPDGRVYIAGKICYDG
jgi:hypothetical protein